MSKKLAEAFGQGRAAYKPGSGDYAPATNPYTDMPLRMEFNRGWRSAQQMDVGNPYRRKSSDAQIEVLRKEEEREESFAHSQFGVGA